MQKKAHLFQGVYRIFLIAMCRGLLWLLILKASIKICLPSFSCLDGRLALQNLVCILMCMILALDSMNYCRAESVGSGSCHINPLRKNQVCLLPGCTRPTCVDKMVLFSSLLLTSFQRSLQLSLPLEEKVITEQDPFQAIPPLVRLLAWEEARGGPDCRVPGCVAAALWWDAQHEG